MLTRPTVTACDGSHAAQDIVSPFNNRDHFTAQGPVLSNDVPKQYASSDSPNGESRMPRTPLNTPYEYIDGARGSTVNGVPTADLLRRPTASSNRIANQHASSKSPKGESALLIAPFHTPYDRTAGLKEDVPRPVTTSDPFSQPTAPRHCTERQHSLEPQNIGEGPDMVSKERGAQARLPITGTKRKDNHEHESESDVRMRKFLRTESPTLD